MRFAPALLLLLLLPQKLFSRPDFSQENATRILRHLILDIGPRPMGSPAEHRALEYAVSSFRESGCDTAYIMPFDRTGRVNTASGVAVGVKRGISARIILIGGHIDSAGPEIPGADDDGSGAATVMELARSFCKTPTHSTLVFCCFGGEEEGLQGSKFFASAYADIDSIDLMLQIDMANGLGTIDLDPDTHLASAPAWLVRAVVEEFYGLGYTGLRYPTHFFSLNYAFPAGSGSDHESFLERGIPAIDLSTDVSKPIHTPRDNFENFDPRGLKRSGDVMSKLIDRFDPGVPGRTTEHYWLYLLYHTPLFVPLWALRSFAGVSLAVAAAALFSIRKRREPPGSPSRVRWSGLKIWLASLMIAGAGWCSSDVIALIRGIRHPWLTAIPMYCLLGALAALIAGWFAVRTVNRLKLSNCPYVFFKRAAIMLAIVLISLGILSVKLSVEPALALLFISMAALTRRPALKLLWAFLSPWCVLRLIFSEWDELLFRNAASGIPPGPATWVLNILMVLLLSIILLPFLFILASVVRDSPELKRFVPVIKSRTTLAAAIVSATVFSGYLLSIPVFDQYWYRDVHIDEVFDATRHTREVNVRSSEYLNGTSIAHDNRDTVIDARTTKAELTPGAGFDTSWFRVAREEEQHNSGDATLYDVRLRLTSRTRPLSVSVSYSSGGEPLHGFDTPCQFRSDRGATRIEWYSFPDSELVIPVSFTSAGHDSVTETVEARFAELADPVRITAGMTYVIPRTTFVSRFVYRR